ncbi:unnamed protein product [Adineta steineri]|uniref:Uncharacterized protein n=1 Tax=Adineta steineri TaxID=433720 RepID=A0A815AN98_9BILA|nr:unnamed protein product [Adineta steineri]CAF1267506.1 unnamed protein product [Adineta steineri]CAF1497226.1 unnamed protein product [Adineta steineri]CAF4059112.1 unnamed protein product [Adineta steineri]
MFKLLISSNRIVLLIFIILLASLNRFSRATAKDNSDITDLSNDEVEDQRRMHDLNQLRYFLLTANAKQLAAKRQQQAFRKRQLIHEYLKSIHNPIRLQEVKSHLAFDHSYFLDVRIQNGHFMARLSEQWTIRKDSFKREINI